MSKVVGRISQITVGGETFDCESGFVPNSNQGRWDRPKYSASSTIPVKVSEFSVDDVNHIIKTATGYKRKCESDTINSILDYFGQKPMKKVLGFEEVLILVSDSDSGKAFKSAIEKVTTIKVIIDKSLIPNSVILKELN